MDSDARRVTSRQGGVDAGQKAVIMWCRSVRLLWIYYRTSGIARGVFPSPSLHRLALLLLCRLRNHFLTLSYNHLFYHDFLRTVLDA